MAERRKEKSWSIYSTCNDIPLKLFIEVYTGNRRAIVKKGNPPGKVVNETAYQIICEYTDIVNSKGVQFEIDSRSKFINLSSKIECLLAVKVLISNKEYQHASNILNAIKFKKNISVSEENKENVLSLIESEIALSKYRLDMLKKRMSVDQKKTPSKHFFYREIALVSQYFKMSIDVNKCPASVYANYVRNMIDEIKIRKSWQTKRQ